MIIGVLLIIKQYLNLMIMGLICVAISRVPGYFVHPGLYDSPITWATLWGMYTIWPALIILVSGTIVTIKKRFID